MSGEEEKSKKVVTFMPGISLSEPIQVGQVNFWPLSAAANFVKDTDLAKSIESIAKQYHTSKGEEIGDITVADVSNDFEPYDEDDIQGLRLAKTALAFVAVKDNPIRVPVFGSQITEGLFAYDNFTMHSHAILPSGRMSYRCGSYVRSLSGMEISDFKFYLPPYVRVVKVKEYDAKMLKALGKVLSQQKALPDVQRIFQSMEWINLAYSNADDFGHKTRVVLAATSLEAFLDLPRDYKKSCFTQAVNRISELEKIRESDDCLEINTNAKEPFSYNLPELKKGLLAVYGQACRDNFKYESDCNEYGSWAKQFYELRSSIVHGDTVEDSALRHTNKKEHFQIAIAALTYFLRDQLFLLDAYEYNMDEIIVLGKRKKIEYWFAEDDDEDRIQGRKQTTEETR